MSTLRADFVVRGIGRLVTLAGPVPRVGAAMRELGIVEDAALASRAGRIVWVGPEGELEAAVALTDAVVIDAGGALVTPGFVDPHTHLAYAGDRDDEIRQRLAGVSYADIAAAGGGIVRTVAATREASVEALVRGVEQRLDEMLVCGTTTAEIKSGYGLETGAELRSLEAIREASSRHPVSVVATFLGAHEIPREHRADRQRYIDAVIEEMIPEVSARGLASFGDVFCEKGVFTVGESRRILEACRAHGLGLRIHADELGWTGGAELAAELRAASADHLVHVSAAGMAALAESGCVATLLPAAAYFLRLGRYAPARELVDAGVAVALATDINPGGGLSPSLPFVMSVASFGMGLAIEEALTAVTVNAAASLGLGSEVGQLVPGYRTDLVVLRSSRLLDLVRPGVSAVHAVAKDGRVVVRDGRLLGRETPHAGGTPS